MGIPQWMRKVESERINGVGAIFYMTFNGL